MATKKFKRLPSGRIQYHGETFAGFNKPKRAPKGIKLKKFPTDIVITLISENTKTQNVGLTSERGMIVALQKIKHQQDTGRVNIFGNEEKTAASVFKRQTR